MTLPITVGALPPKPRSTFITAAIDGGLGLAHFTDLVDLATDGLDFVKFGWGSALITKCLQEKISVLRDRGIGFWIGGTAFELAYAQRRLPEFARWIKSLGATHVEISDGSIDLPNEEKLRIISEWSGEFQVLSEIGSKDVNKVMTPREWIAHIQAEREAGAWKIIAEGRESGTVGIYRNTGEIREGLVLEISEAGVPLDSLIFEAPQKSQQVWLIQRFGAGINLGNIALEQALNVHCLRMGLRSDTIDLALKNIPADSNS